jgi:hypothetical protein
MTRCAESWLRLPLALYLDRPRHCMSLASADARTTFSGSFSTLFGRLLDEVWTFVGEVGTFALVIGTKVGRFQRRRQTNGRQWETHVDKME